MFVNDEKIPRVIYHEDNLKGNYGNNYYGNDYH